MSFIPSLNLFLSFLTIIGQIIILIYIISFIINNKKIISFFSKKAVIFSLIISLVATLGSLFYSEIANFEPCKLCWFQRIFMYPQTVILITAALTKKNDKTTAYSSLTLSIAGMIISGYHYLSQLKITPETFCSITNYSADCSQIFFNQFGYITIPMMSLTTFSLIAILMFSLLKKP